jgi:5'-phosphate synthase pdxT subunit
VYPDQIAECDGLVIPGGESTTMTKLINEMKLRDELDTFSGPLFGTCAGAILLSQNTGDPKVQALNRMDIRVNRNGYGRQVDSFIQSVQLTFDEMPFRGIFIRAPKIVDFSSEVAVLGTFENEVVCLRDSNNLLTTFHPELSGDERIHKYFIDHFF